MSDDPLAAEGAQILADYIDALIGTALAEHFPTHPPPDMLARVRRVLADYDVAHDALRSLHYHDDVADDRAVARIAAILLGSIQ